MTTCDCDEGRAPPVWRRLRVPGTHMPEAVRGGGLPALKSLGEPAKVLQETKGRLFAA